MPSTPGSRLGESWVEHEDDDDNSGISWDANDQSDESEPEIPVRKRSNRPSPIQISNARQKSPRGSSSFQEPDLVMPSIGEYQPRSRTITPNSKTSQVYQRAVRQPPDVPQSLPPTRPPRRTRPSKQLSSGNVMEKLVSILSSTFEWIFDIIGQTLKSLKKPISWVLAAYLFAGLLTLTQNLVTSSIYTALTPVCRVPFVSYLHLPICSYKPSDPTQPTISSTASNNAANPEFSSLMQTQSQFEDILSSSASGVSLPLDMKRSETSIRDLRQIVRFSSLSSKNELVLEFDGFIETARAASYDLQKFNSHVGRAVDIVLSTARWTQRVLDDMAHQHDSSLHRGSIIPRFITNTLLAPFQPLTFTESRLLDQYISHTRIISGEIEQLISEAQALLQILQNIEDRLDVIHAISLRDHISAQDNKDEILSNLWTFLGGNRGALGKYDSQLRLLGRVGEYRKLAFAHVSGVILKLQAMGAELEELRTRVGSAELERNVKGKKEKVPLAVHVESIRLGVERLEMGREKAREVEQRMVRRVIDAGSGDGKLEVDSGGTADKRFWVDS